MADDDITLDLTLASGGVARPGYGIDAIVTHKAPWTDPERVKYVSELQEVLDLGYTDDSPEFLAVSAVLLQQPHPQQVAILKSIVLVTQQYTVEVQGSPRNLFQYVIDAGGEGFEDDVATFTSGASATIEQVHSGLVTDINTVVGKNFTAAFAPLVVADFVFTATNATETFTKVAHGLKTGDGPVRVSNAGGALPAGLAAATDYWVIRVDADNFKLATTLAFALAGTNLLITTDGTGTQTLSDTGSTARPSDPFTVTGSANANWFWLKVRNTAALFVSQTHTVSGFQADLLDLLNEDAAWYCLQLLYPSKDYVSDAAAFVEANGRVLACAVSDNRCIKTSIGSATDVGATLFGLQYKRTMLAYHPAPREFLDAAWMGRFLQGDPGTINPKWKTLVGVTPTKFSTTDKTNLEARRMNGYRTYRRRNITFEGTVFSTTNKFFDTTRNLDWLSDNIIDDAAERFGDAENIPFTREGIAVIEGSVKGTCARAVRQGVGADDPAPTVTPPVFEDIPTIDKSDKILRNMKFSLKLAGGINKARVIGTLSF